MAAVAVAPQAPVELIRTVLTVPAKVDNLVLAGTAETVTVPSAVTFALFKATADMNINRNETATDPAGDVTDGSAAWLIQAGDGPQLFNVKGIATFSVIGTGKLRIAWYRDASDV